MSIDLQDFITHAMKAARAERLKQSDQLTLGELILKIEVIANKPKGKEKEGPFVYYDFEYLYPTYIDSWRGSYDELALNFCYSRDSKNPPLTVVKFLKLLRDAVGKTFTGYKGGDFMMGKQTPVWVANHGNSGNTAVIDVVDGDYSVILITAYRDF